MNTVFKFYYQAWILLGLAGAYGIFRTWQVLRELLFARVASAFLIAVIAGTIGAGVYTRYIPAYAVDQTSPISLDGLAWLKSAQPSDYATIQWLRSHANEEARRRRIRLLVARRAGRGEGRRELGRRPRRGHVALLGLLGRRSGAFRSSRALRLRALDGALPRLRAGPGEPLA